MDKAARAVRRSSAKLLSLGGGHSDLHVLLSEVKDMRNTAKTFMNAQNAVSQDFLKWAVNEDNRAVQDVAHQLAELNLLWTEVQREFGEHLKDYRHMFDMILEGEKHVHQSKTYYAACEQKEMKARKDLKKAFKILRPQSSEIQNLEGKLAQAERAKDLAQIEVSDRIRENEAVKLIRLKEGLTKLTSAYSDFARKCAVVFDAQQDIVQQIPDVVDQELEDMKYTGSGATMYRVQQAKEKVHNFRRNRNRKSIPQSYNEPPPPYCAVDTSDQSLDSCEATPPRRNTSPQRRLSSQADNTHQQQQCEADIPGPPASMTSPPPPPPPSSSTHMPYSSNSQTNPTYPSHSTLPPAAYSQHLSNPQPTPTYENIYPQIPFSTSPYKCPPASYSNLPMTASSYPPTLPPSFTHHIAPPQAPEGPADAITIPVQQTSSDEDLHNVHISQVPLVTSSAEHHLPQPSILTQASPLTQQSKLTQPSSSSAKLLINAQRQDPDSDHDDLDFEDDISGAIGGLKM